MSDDFFGDLGKSITRATQRAAMRTGSLIESTKINAMITAETKSIEKLHLELGELVYERVMEEKITPDEEMQAIIEELKGHLEKILNYRVELAEVRGMRVCPSCGEIIDPQVLFCPKCGVATPPPEEEEKSVLHAALPEAEEEEADDDEEEESAEDDYEDFEDYEDEEDVEDEVTAEDEEADEDDEPEEDDEPDEEESEEDDEPEEDDGHDDEEDAEEAL